MPTNRQPCANDCTNSRKNSRTASRFALRPKVKQEHNEAAENAHGLSASVFGSRQARQGASAGFSGCRGAALTQSRSDSGVYTGLVCYDGVRVQESASCGRRKMQQRSVSRICDTGYIPLPRSLTRCARSFGCGERYQLTGGAEISWEMPGRSLTEKR